MASHTCPPHVDTMEKWGKHFEPDLRSNEEKKHFHITCGVLLGIFLFFIFLFQQLNPDLAAPLSAICFLGGALLGGIWFVGAKINRHRALNIALKNAPSKYRNELEKRYQDVVKEISEYDQCILRMHDIINEAKFLLK